MLHCSVIQIRKCVTRVGVSRSLCQNYRFRGISSIAWHRRVVFREFYEKMPHTVMLFRTFFDKVATAHYFRTVFFALNCSSAQHYDSITGSALFQHVFSVCLECHMIFPPISCSILKNLPIPAKKYAFWAMVAAAIRCFPVFRLFSCLLLHLCSYQYELIGFPMPRPPSCVIPQPSLHHNGN